MNPSQSGPSRCDVVVTGLGVVSPLGWDVPSSFERLLAGETGIRDVELELGTRALGAPVAFASDGEPVEEMALQAAREAWTHAGLGVGNVDPSRVGVIFGTSKAGLRSLTSYLTEVLRQGDAETLKRLWSRSQLSSPAVRIAEAFGVCGAVETPVAACATGMLAVQQGARLIEAGVCDVVIAGSVDASLVEIVVGSYRKLGILSKSADPQTACRPFDRDRDGFVIGEGAGAVVLQRATRLHPHQRPLVRYLGGENLSTASDLTSLADASEDYVELLKRTLARAGVSREQIGLVNLHGTATRDNDLLEMQAVSRVLGSQTPCVGFKGALGHLLGAAGAVELVYAIQAVVSGTSPATTGCVHIDRASPVDVIMVSPRTIETPYLLKLSAGFGGHLVTGVFEGV